MLSTFRVIGVALSVSVLPAPGDAWKIKMVPMSNPSTSGYATVQRDAIMRASPMGISLESIPKGHVVKVLGEGAHCQIRWNGRDGYVENGHLKLISDKMAAAAKQVDGHPEVIMRDKSGAIVVKIPNGNAVAIVADEASVGTKALKVSWNGGVQGFSSVPGRRTHEGFVQVSNLVFPPAPAAESVNAGPGHHDLVHQWGYDGKPMDAAEAAARKFAAAAAAGAPHHHQEPDRYADPKKIVRAQEAVAAAAKPSLIRRATGAMGVLMRTAGNTLCRGADPQKDVGEEPGSYAADAETNVGPNKNYAAPDRHLGKLDVVPEIAAEVPTTEPHEFNNLVKETFKKLVEHEFTYSYPFYVRDSKNQGVYLNRHEKARPYGKQEYIFVSYQEWEFTITNYPEYMWPSDKSALNSIVGKHRLLGTGEKSNWEPLTDSNRKKLLRIVELALHGIPGTPGLNNYSSPPQDLLPDVNRLQARTVSDCEVQMVFNKLPQADPHPANQPWRVDSLNVTRKPGDGGAYFFKSVNKGANGSTRNMIYVDVGVSGSVSRRWRFSLIANPSVGQKVVETMRGKPMGQGEASVWQPVGRTIKMRLYALLETILFMEVVGNEVKSTNERHLKHTTLTQTLVSAAPLTIAESISPMLEDIAYDDRLQSMGADFRKLSYNEGAREQAGYRLRNLTQNYRKTATMTLDGSTKHRYSTIEFTTSGAGGTHIEMHYFDGEGMMAFGPAEITVQYTFSGRPGPSGTGTGNWTKTYLSNESGACISGDTRIKVQLPAPQVSFLGMPDTVFKYANELVRGDLVLTGTGQYVRLEWIQKSPVLDRKAFIRFGGANGPKVTDYHPVREVDTTARYENFKFPHDVEKSGDRFISPDGFKYNLMLDSTATESEHSVQLFDTDEGLSGNESDPQPRIVAITLGHGSKLPLLDHSIYNNRDYLTAVFGEYAKKHTETAKTGIVPFEGARDCSTQKVEEKGEVFYPIKELRSIYADERNWKKAVEMEMTWRDNTSTHGES